MASNLVGKVLMDQFRVDSFLDAGGMGSVYRVWDLKRNVPLAMKVMHADLAEDPTMFKRFKREARALSKLAHPNIIPFYGLFDDDHIIFMLERFIDGLTLKDLFKKKKGEPLSEIEALTYLKAICSALGYAHEHGVIHCDVKSANIMMDRGGSIFLGDFGIARHSDSSTTTMAGAGTPAYMAPEQILGKTVYPSTDIYAMGILLYEMLTGQRPYRGNESGTVNVGDTVNERIRYAQLNLTPPDPRILNPGLNPKLVKILMKALEKDSEKRFQSCQEMLLDACGALNLLADQIPDRIDVSKHSWFISGRVQQTKSDVLDFSQFSKTDKKDDIFFGNLKIKFQKKFIKLKDWFVFRLKFVIVILVMVIGLAILVKIYGEQYQAPISEISTSGNLLIPSQISILTNTSIPIKTVTSEKRGTILKTETKTIENIPALSGSIEIRISSNDNMPMVYIPAGSFLMGSESSEAEKDEYPQHKVYLDEYWIDQHEVTNGQFKEFVIQTGYISAAEKTGCSYLFEDDCIQGVNWKKPFGDETIINDNEPIIHMNWYDAMAYCEWVGRRLPTEAEWEKAARGEEGQRFPWGDNWVEDQFANFCDKNCELNSRDATVDDGYHLLAPVGSYPNGASPYGVLDMAGNVLEWVFDFYGESYYSNSLEWINPTGPESGKFRGIRGGSWAMEPKFMRSSFRGAVLPQFSNNRRGFRCAMDAY